MIKADRLSDEDLSLLAIEVDAVLTATPRSARDLLSKAVADNLDSLAAGFYEAMAAYPKGDVFLGEALDEDRFQSDVRLWLQDLFSLGPRLGEQIRRRQMEVGAAYARLKIPCPMVMHGFRALRKALGLGLIQSQGERDEVASSLSLMALLLDVALTMMTTAYGRHAERVARSDEALRQYSVGQDPAVERERQRASLLDWAQDIYYQTHMSGRERFLPMLSRSEFGLWFTHRAEILLGRTTEYESASDAIERCDDLVERLNYDLNADHLEILRSLKDEVNILAALMSLMFVQLDSQSYARDPLTKLLNKQFLAPAVSREIALTQQGRPPFCLIAFSLGRQDPRRLEPDQQNWEDIVRRSAQIILSMSRSSDAAFRLNDYTILVVRVESTFEEAVGLAEEAVLRMTAGHLGPTGHTIHGLQVRHLVLEYDGQPDPRQVIRLAEQQIHQLEERAA